LEKVGILPRVSSESFPKAHRVLRSCDFKQAVDHGTHCKNRQFLLALLKRADQEASRLGLTVTRKFGKAVDRNRAKRKAREVFRRHFHDIKGGFDVVVLIRPAAAKSGMGEFENGFLDVMEQACLLKQN